MIQDEAIILKSEIFDIIQKQEEQTNVTNILQQKKLQKFEELREISKEISNTITKQTKELENIQETADNIMIIKAEIFDIMEEQDKYITRTNELQQIKAKKLQKLQFLKCTPKLQQ
jgi:hypothetical protein